MKTILLLFKKEGKVLTKGIFLGILSGLVSFSFLTFFNHLIDEILGNRYKEINMHYIYLFILIIVLYVWSRRSLSYHIIKFSQNVFWKLRIDILMMILKSDYNDIEQKRNRIHTALVSDIGALTQASLNTIHFITSVVMALACLAYMFTLSTGLFFITLFICSLGIVVYQLGARQNTKNFETSRTIEDGFMRNFRAMLSGIKEINLNPLKGFSILDKNIIPLSKQAFNNNTSAFVGFLNNQITGQILFYMLISSVLLIFSVILKVEVVIVVNFLFILLNLLGSVEAIMVLLPGLAAGRVSINRLSELKAELEKQKYVNHVSASSIHKNDFRNVEIKGLEFRYQSEKEEESFVIGPLDFNINSQEIVFIHGGNGSGKTTFIQSLLGLLHYHHGSIHYNEKILDQSTYSEYKTLYAAVFNDYYLFDAFYGNENFDRTKANSYLKLFEIDDKVVITDKGFSAIDLSTGQRKRLALIATILENRPILVLDEWAADQDPHFRKRFYMEILPVLKAEGFSIIAITHDDKYYQCCDRLYKMEYGKLIDLTAEKINKKLELELQDA